MVFSFTLLAELHHRTKIIFEKLTHWFIRLNSLLLLKSEQNKLKSCICLCLLYFILLIHISQCFITPCFITPCFITPCFITPCFITPCFINPCFIIPCFINPVHVLPIQSSPILSRTSAKNELHGQDLSASVNVYKIIPVLGAICSFTSY